MMTSTSTWRGSAIDAGPRAKCDQVVYEAIAKAAEIVVQSRCPTRFGTPTKSSSSSRFNLHIAENAHVRKILAPFKKSLHVPLRLDVYYRKRDQRELLERWCLEYAPSHVGFFAEECSSLDPLVQLRHVCKKLVLWLRSLYCLARILPCRMKSEHIGFSIYVSDDNDNSVDLCRNLGFHAQSHSSVYTPYGRLDLQVLYAPRQVVSRLFPKQPSARWTTTQQTKSRPIPTKQRVNHNPFPVVAQSAPVQVTDYLGQQHQQQQFTQQQPMLATTMPRPPMMEQNRSNSMKTEERQTQRGVRPSVGRAQSAVSDREISYEKEAEGGGGMEKRVLSGLSLAMLNAEEEQEQLPSPRSEQRRAALHHAPPSITSITSPKPNEYGYAYNNHIPWGHLKPGTPTRTLLDNPTLPPASPNVLGSTPPMLFVTSKTPEPVAPPSHPTHLLPFRNKDEKVAPPFAAMPTTLGETPRAPPMLQQPQQQGPLPETTSPAPISSLDLLHSSPFHKDPEQIQNSLLSSLSGTTEQFHHSELYRSMASGVLMDQQSTFLENDDNHDMPFAVETEAASKDLGASAALAHKCATASRLKLFDSFDAPQESSQVSALAHQLAEFKTFGASLMVAPNEETGSSSTSTPISLKT